MKLFKCLALLAALPMAGIAVMPSKPAITTCGSTTRAGIATTRATITTATTITSPAQTYTGYRHHYVIYYPSRPKYYYYYNPYKKSVLGSLPLLLQRRRASIRCSRRRKVAKAIFAQIPEAAFPKPTATPPIPEATDGEKLDLPPDDPPASDEQGLPKTAA